MDSKWTELIIKVPAAEVDRAGDIANMVVPYGIYIEDYSNLEEEALEIAHIDLIDEELLKKDRSHGLVHIYISPEDNPMEAVSYLSERLGSLDIDHEISMQGCEEKDWINNWKKYFKPIAVGEKLLIRPIWEEPVEPGDRVILNLEPGLAFGTGTHETTRLCMELLEKYTKKGDTVLDMGCGSGILSVAALLLGAERAVGVDIDALAVKTAVENAKINKVDDRFDAIYGDLTEKVTGQFNILVANIVADVVIELSKTAPSLMYEDSIFIISGIIDSREDDVFTAIAGRFEIVEKREERGWVAAACRLKSK